MRTPIKRGLHAKDAPAIKRPLRVGVVGSHNFVRFVIPALHVEEVIMTSKFVNLTPHALVIRVGDRDLTVPPSGMQARVAVTPQDAGVVEAEEGLVVPVARNAYGKVEGLPALEEGTIYLVSLLILDRCAGRGDVMSPDTGATAVRYTDGPRKGQVEAVVRLLAAPSA